MKRVSKTVDFFLQESFSKEFIKYPLLSFDAFFSSFPFAESPPLLTNNGLLMRNWTMFLREKWQITSLCCQEVIKIWKQIWWSNDKTIIDLGYCKIWWFVSVSQINYLPKLKAEANNLVATDKSQYFAQPRPIIFNYSTIICKPHYLMPFLRCDLITQPQCWIKTV